MDEKDESEQATQISLHSIKNILGNRQQLSLFTEGKVKEFAVTYGVPIEREFSRFGIDLTDVQQKIMEAVLHGFTKTGYKGNLDPMEKLDLAKEKYPHGNLPDSYKYLRELPRLRVTQAQILKWAGISPQSAGGVQEALKALKHLGTTQYCFYYTRLAFDEEGIPKKDKEGEWQKEEVIAVDTLFTIKEIRDKKTGGVLEYYEITTSPIFLDQRESFFMLIPFNWREEVKGLVGQRKASSYTFRFLLFLRFQFEMRRRSSRERKSYIIKMTSEEMAINLKMPESVYNRKKDRANKILNEVYSVAKSLGYLTNYERTETGDILYLNEEKYSPNSQEEKLLPVNEQEEDSNEMKQARELLALLIQEKRKVDPKYNPMAGGQIREHSLQNLVALLKMRTFEEVKEVVLWGVNRSYWCVRIGTPAKLRKYFNEAYTEMKTSTSKEQEYKPEKLIEKNKNLARAIAAEVEKINDESIKIEVLNKHMEIISGSHVTSLRYSEKGFIEQVENTLRKRGITIENFPVLQTR